MVANWQLSMRGSSAQLAFAAASDVGAAGGAPRAADDVVVIDLTTKVESQAVLEAKQLEDKKAGARRALLQAKDKKLQDKKAAKATERAVKIDRLKMLSNKRKLENTIRKKLERQKGLPDVSNAANILQTMRQDWAGSKEAIDEDSAGSQEVIDEDSAGSQEAIDENSAGSKEAIDEDSDEDSDEEVC